ncbi:hypothetical protein [Streptomyces kaempferi]|uniref:Uncharacterized protein n=1 Tax=Streptomyces kaempferi TaxID=333725 RepID=A0ABW3XKG4_9ACTN
MAARRPSKIWRIVIPSPDGPAITPQRSETATRNAVEAEKQTTTADRITVEKWEDGRWGEWLRWVRTDHTWNAE